VSDQLNRSVEELELSVRSYNCLKNAGIQTSANCAEDRIGNAADQEFRPQIAERNQGNLATMGLALGMKPTRTDA